jgi:hypothetical protein
MTQCPVAEPAHASSTLSELKRTRLGDPAGELWLAEPYARGGAVNVDACLCRALFGPGDDRAVIVAEQGGDSGVRAYGREALQWTRRPPVGQQARVDRSVLGPHGQRFATEIHCECERLHRSVGGGVRGDVADEAVRVEALDVDVQTPAGVRAGW